MRLSALIVLVLLFGFLIDYGSGSNVQGYSSKPNELTQPAPLILVKDSSFILQPVVENIDLRGYEFVMTLKLYYKDRMVKPLEFKKGPPLDS